jgi:hypothetical protein
MNPIPEPAELHEAECNALGLYGLPAAALEQFAPDRPDPGRWACADTDARAADARRRNPPGEDLDRLEP